MPLIAETKQPTFSASRIRPLWILLGAVALLGLGIVARVVPGPATVDRVTVRNGTAYDLEVVAASADHDGWTPVVIALAGADTSIGQVIDHGGEWVFRFTGQGSDGGEVTVSRDELAADNWVMTVPSSVGDRIRSTGVPDSPAQSGS